MNISSSFMDYTVLSKLYLLYDIHGFLSSGNKVRSSVYAFLIHSVGGAFSFLNG